MPQRPGQYQAALLVNLRHPNEEGAMLALTGTMGAVGLNGSGNRIAACRQRSGAVCIVYAGPTFYPNKHTDEIYYLLQAELNSTLFVPQGELGKGQVKQLAMQLDDEGCIRVFYIGDNDNIFSVTQTTPDSDTWGPQTPMLTLDGHAVKASFFRVITNSNGLLEVFYVGTNGHLYLNWQLGPRGQWNTPVQYENFTVYDFDVCINADGLLSLFVLDQHGKVYQDWQTAQNPDIIAPAYNWHGSVQINLPWKVQALAADRNYSIASSYSSLRLTRRKESNTKMN